MSFVLLLLSSSSCFFNFKYFHHMFQQDDNNVRDNPCFGHNNHHVLLYIRRIEKQACCVRDFILRVIVGGCIKQNQKRDNILVLINNSIQSAVLTVDTCHCDKRHAVDPIQFGRHNRKFVRRVHPVVPIGTAHRPPQNDRRNDPIPSGSHSWMFHRSIRRVVPTGTSKPYDQKKSKNKKPVDSDREE